MLKVGLTGGIGSGKSEVARRLAAHGAVVVDADAVAREVVAPGTPGHQAVVAAFGPTMLRPDGGLDRARLGALVFTDEDARKRLESIVHPLVRQRSQELMDAAPAGSVVVYDVPLLVESELGEGFDLVVVVDAPEDVQVARLVGARGMSAADARARLAAQAGRQDRLAAADVVIDNSGSLDDLERQVGALWADLQRRLAGAGGAGRSR
ncbi:MAG: dephospho-CoA kinase [Actinomycetota bacterium]|nr:dephospho-CoA kinase [Actinomycetota bacterium]